MWLLCMRRGRFVIGFGVRFLMGGRGMLSSAVVSWKQSFVIDRERCRLQLAVLVGALHYQRTDTILFLLALPNTE